ncbi:MAG TPA: cytochrome c-type biogenesis CcmF C-terminal domain-containing protein, partial [Aggregatilineales bacterium]|nr:cytochrome c-type biogenesis CcmF C-terminal domain-containing protein [Aggregatilineales bacterium]
VLFAGYATLLEIYKGTAARHRAHGEAWHIALMRLFARNRRRYGGYTIHVGVVIIGIGIIGSTIFQEVKQTTLSPGETMDIGPYTLRYDEAFNARAVDDRTMFVANTTLFRNGKEVAQLRPRRDVFEGSANPMTIAGVHATLENDIYVLLTFWENDRVTFRVYRNPLIAFVWWGGMLFVIGTVVAVYPQPESVSVSRRQHLPMVARPAAAGD